jgi:MSHA biogenesis protein MshO
MKNRIELQRGFTLVEMVMVIVITGIIAGVVAIFIRAPVQGYFDMETRVELTDTADTALRRIGRDLRLALPNSVRTPNASCIEFLPTITGGRYRADVTGNAAAPGAQLDFTTATTTFDVLGGMTSVPVKDDMVVVYNLGIPGADAYSGVNRATIQSADAASITLSAATLFPLASPANRFQVIPGKEQAVSYVCSGAGTDASGNGTGVLQRFSGYGFVYPEPTVCPEVPAGAPQLARNVSGCAFVYNPLVNERSGLVSLQVSLTRNSETVNLYHEVHVSNVP